MPTKPLLLATVAAAAALIAPALTAQTAGAPPLIERSKLFGNPTKTGAQLSPDGKWISYIAPRDGVLNVWVAPAATPEQGKLLTAEKARPIRQAFWTADSKQVLYINDKGGDENFLLYGVDVATGAEKALTPFDKTRVQIVGGSETIKDKLLIAVNNRDPKWHDVYMLEPSTGKLTKVLENTGNYAGFVADDNLQLRMAVKATPDGGQAYYRVNGTTVDEKPFLSYGLDDSLTTNPAGFTTDGKTFYWIDSRNRDTAALFAQDMASGKMTLLAENAKADIAGSLRDPKTGRVQAYAVNYLKNEYVPLDDSIKADLAFLKAQNKGQFFVGSRTDADDKWIVSFDPVTAPSQTYVYDRKSKSLALLYVSRPELEGAPLVAMEPVEIKARDGLTLVSYLSKPQGATAATPLVLLVHGGPWARDGFGYNSYHQWLANRGYAVLSVNYRGSTGFGKKFISAGDLQWGRKMHDDLIDATDWAIAKGLTTKDKVAIMGGSYGGYATLAGLTFTPEKFACGVDIVGPSNLMTLLQTIPPYWEAGKLQFYKRMGDPTTEDGRALLKERSPLTFADRIKRPLLIGQGANDPRVNVAESDQIVSAMKAKNIPVTYVVFPDEGHGFARPVNNIAFNAVTENFLAGCLGGRSEPIGTALTGSTAQVREGAGNVKGLAPTAPTAK